MFTSVSEDGGKSFVRRTTVPLDSGYLHAPAEPAVRENGMVLVPYLVHYGRVPAGTGRLRGRYPLLVSEDGGRSWSDPWNVAETIELGNAGEWALMLKGLGAGGLALDETGGPYDGSAYMTWPTVLDDRIQIVTARSRDGGLSWNAPVRVNSGGRRSNHSTPMVAVNRDGIVAVTWNDRRHDPNEECFQHYVAVSTDGGRTFSPGTRVSEVEICPGARSRWLNGGETQGLAALPDGRFRLIWSVGSRGDLRLWTAVVRVE